MVETFPVNSVNAKITFFHHRIVEVINILLLEELNKPEYNGN